MDKLPYEELERLVADARQTVVPGSCWRHYKGSEYTITGIGILEATNEVAVIYTPLEHPAVSFVRSLTVWQEAVDYDGETIPRFRRTDG